MKLVLDDAGLGAELTIEECFSGLVFSVYCKENMDEFDFVMTPAQQVELFHILNNRLEADDE